MLRTNTAPSISRGLMWRKRQKFLLSTRTNTHLIIQFNRFNPRQGCSQPNDQEGILQGRSRGQEPSWFGPAADAGVNVGHVMARLQPCLRPVAAMKDSSHPRTFLIAELSR